MSETSIELPFQPIRNNLYSSQELLSNFSFDDEQSMARTLDFNCYRFFVVNGRAAPREPYAGMMEALHDNSIVRAMYQFLQQAELPTAAIMGGHREDRGSATYVDVAKIAKRLSEEGFLMASGGGPGCMEATHLGALLKGHSDAELADAVKLLATQPKLPDSMDIVSPEGVVNTERVAQIHRWAAPAVELMQKTPDGGQSLAVPTWHYGHEPISPLATHVAKYFLNSIREDVLLALATNGVVFTRGRAGTMQEIFQDAAQNYYSNPDQPFAPMVFFDKTFWTETLPVNGVLDALFKLGGEARYEQFKAKVIFTDSIDETVDFLQANLQKPENAMKRMEALGFGKVMAEARALSQ